VRKNVDFDSNDTNNYLTIGGYRRYLRELVRVITTYIIMSLSENIRVYRVRT
jgi:hypothetical protein